MSVIKLNKPGFFRAGSAIGRVTFSEIVRDKILYNSVLCAALLFGISFLASNLTYTQPERILIDFGLAALNISCTFIAILIGGSMLAKEFDRRTIFVALSKPITRHQFLVGKFSGILLVLTANWLILSTIFFAGVLATGAVVSGAMVWAVGLTLVHSVVVAAIAILFSTLTTPSLAIIITIGLYLVGQNISQLRFLAKKVENAWVSESLSLITHLLPNFEHFQLGTKVVYELPVSLTFGLTGLLYGVCLIAILVLVSGFLINRKEI